MSKEIATTLKRAAKLVTKGWCQHSAAKTKTGRNVESIDRKAVQWCLIGAVDRASNDNSGLYLKAMYVVGNLIRGKRLYASAVLWNDNPRRKQEEVVALLLKAAKEAEKE